MCKNPVLGKDGGEWVYELFFTGLSLGRYQVHRPFFRDCFSGLSFTDLSLRIPLCADTKYEPLQTFGMWKVMAEMPKNIWILYNVIFLNCFTGSLTAKGSVHKSFNGVDPGEDRVCARCIGAKFIGSMVSGFLKEINYFNQEIFLILKNWRSITIQMADSNKNRTLLGKFTRTG